MQNVPELKALLGDNVATSFNASSTSQEKKQWLRSAFETMMTRDKQAVAANLTQLVSRVQAQESKSDLDKLLLRLHVTYPGDVGCFAIYFLNIVTLQPGEALFLGPNEPHAYLFGDCMECMSCSDNVVRAGLTPKFIDVKTLCNMLTYDDESFNSMFMKTGVQVADNIYRYAPPVDEFMVHRVELANNKTASLKLASISIFVQMKGESLLVVGDEKQQVKPGSIIVIAANANISLTALNGDAQAFVASCNEERI